MFLWPLIPRFASAIHFHQERERTCNPRAIPSRRIGRRRTAPVAPPMRRPEISRRLFRGAPVSASSLADTSPARVEGAPGERRLSLPRNRASVKSSGEPGARSSVVGSIAIELMALYGLLSPPVSLIGKSCTRWKPASADQSMNSRKAPRSPMPRSLAPRSAKSGDEDAGDLFFWREFHLATDEH